MEHGTFTLASQRRYMEHGTFTVAPDPWSMAGNVSVARCRISLSLHFVRRPAHPMLFHFRLHPKTSSVWTAAQAEGTISLWASGHLVLAFVVCVWRWEVGQSSGGATLLQTHRMCASACARALFLRLKVPQYRDGLVGAARQNFGGLFMSPSNLGR